MPMFPDSGVPPGDARNSLPDVNAANCPELWYSTSRCQARFDPAAANAMLAEDMNLIMKGELQYDCTSLTHIERAVRYINQRGLPRAAYMAGGPQYYTAALDPPLTRYNDYLTLTVIPGSTNIAIVTFDAGRGPAYVFRNDGSHLEPGDLVVGKPAITAFYAGSWYMVGLVASQVPIVKKGGIDAWIRTDGNDITGDGTANTPDKAFRTIAGCWTAIGSRYAATPMFSINMRLGIPGTYTGTIIGPFGGKVTLQGDANNPAAYRIDTFFAHPGLWCGMWVGGIASMEFYGVTININNPVSSESTIGLRCLQSAVNFANSRIEISPSNTGQVYFVEAQDGLFVSQNGNIHFIGNNKEAVCIFTGGPAGKFVGAYLIPGQTCTYHFTNINVTSSAMSAGALTTMQWQSATSFIINNVTGPQYLVVENSIINMGGKPLVGTLPGVEGSGGRFIA